MGVFSDSKGKLKDIPFGMRPNKGDFGKPKKTKVKKTDKVDDKYSNWLGKQPCIITGIVAKRGIGANDMHCHHIHGRNPTRNDYLQVPLIGFVHSWGNRAYHNNTKVDFIEKNNICTDDIKEWFDYKAFKLRKKYELETGLELNI